MPTGTVSDAPLLEYRGVMVDAARHFISLPYLFRLIESMPLVKLNVLHLHLSDDEAFTVLLDSHPELAKSSAYNNGTSYYTKADIRAVIALAKRNGVSIVPEFDTPSHVRAWGRASKWQKANITILCEGHAGYNNQFDVSMPELYDFVGEVWAELDDLFQDSPYLHLGGDEVYQICFDKRPNIKTWMALNNLHSLGDIIMYWRSKLKNYIAPNRRAIYWKNTADGLVISANDVIQIWGAQADMAAKIGNASKVILSPSDLIYLNYGQGGLWGTAFGTYSIYKSIYQNLAFFPHDVPRSKILGAEACLWAEVSN